MNKKRYAVVTIELQYELPDNVKTRKQILEFIENVELPKEYREDTFEFVKTYTED